LERNFQIGRPSGVQIGRDKVEEYLVGRFRRDDDIPSALMGDI